MAVNKDMHSSENVTVRHTTDHGSCCFFIKTYSSKAYQTLKATWYWQLSTKTKHWQCRIISYQLDVTCKMLPTWLDLSLVQHRDHHGKHCSSSYTQQ